VGTVGGHVGTVGLHHIDPADRHGQVGIYLSPGARGQGNGRAALSKLVVWAFEVMNLHRLSLDVWSYNERAKRCYRDVGFVREGVLREAHYFGGRFWDVEMYGLLAEEYRSASGGPQAATASSPSVTPL
jgi:RimJ/RimL family protein N-acetyltransferase